MGILIKILATTLITVVGSTYLLADDRRDDAREQVEFGIVGAQKGLWKEAIYRWKRATEIDPPYAEAYNDLAIAYEYEGDFDQAREAYERALSLDPNNATIQENYDLFRETYDRANLSNQ